MVDRSHPKYPEYKEKFEKIWREMSHELDELDKLPRTYGFDGPSTAIYKKHGKRVKELQNEYSFLYYRENE